jgi:hypothetical protein
MKWFILQNEEISGPFDQHKISTEFSDEVLIWGPGMEEWSKKPAWRRFLNSPKSTGKEQHAQIKVTNVEPQITNEHTHKNFEEELVGEEEKSVYEVAELALHQLNDDWFYAYEGKRFGPLNQNHLVLKLNSLDLNKSVFLWKKGMEKWEPLNNFPKILSRIEDQQTKKAA